SRLLFVFFFQAEDGIRDGHVTGVQTCALPIFKNGALLTTPFLDVSSKLFLSDESGLLSIAFHPNYAQNHFFYVLYTLPSSGVVEIGRASCRERGRIEVVGGVVKNIRDVQGRRV